MFEAKIIKDSICNGNRLTTMQVTHPRIVHSEFMTHGMFAKNASSSRAIPYKKMVAKVLEDPFIPEYWGINQSGMQAATELSGTKRDAAIRKWLEARDEAVRIANYMANADSCLRCIGDGKQFASNHADIIRGIAAGEKRDLEAEEAKLVERLDNPCPDCGGDGHGLNVHKQIVNRLLEPWSWITVCVTGDSGAWSNYFSLRCHPDAQPDIQKQAYMAQKAYYESTPDKLEPGEWHTPYTRDEEFEQIENWVVSNPDTIKIINLGKQATYIRNEVDSAFVQISTGRCARTSYLTQEGTRDFGEDIKLHDRLRYHKPLHASPFEHVCQAMGDNKKYAKYIGWKAYRHFLPDEYVIDFQPNHPDFLVSV